MLWTRDRPEIVWRPFLLFLRQYLVYLSLGLFKFCLGFVVSPGSVCAFAQKVDKTESTSLSLSRSKVRRKNTFRGRERAGKKDKREIWRSDLVNYQSAGNRLVAPKLPHPSTPLTQRDLTPQQFEEYFVGLFHHTIMIAKAIGLLRKGGSPMVDPWLQQSCLTTKSNNSTSNNKNNNSNEGRKEYVLGQRTKVETRGYSKACITISIPQ